MRILVTGGAGFIGSHTAKLLAKVGHVAVTFDNLTTGNGSAVQWGPLIEGDLADSSLLQDSMRRHEIEGVLHFSASAYVGESMADPRGYFRNNVVNSLNLLDAMVDTGVQHIVFSSSCATYGIPDEVPITESSSQKPINPYGDSKLFIERALRWYGEAYGMRWAALRYFNAAGSDPDGDIGEDHDPETHVIPLIMQAALGVRSNINIFGTDYDTPDGTAIRDYVHVTDLAEAHVLALQYLVGGGESIALNLSGGRGYTIREVIAEVERVSGKQVPVQQGPRRPGDPAVLIGDATLAKEVLGWRAKRSDLSSIVETAWAWQSHDHDREIATKDEN